MAQKGQRSTAKKKEAYSGKYTSANNRRDNGAKEPKATAIWVCVIVIALGIAVFAGCLYFFNFENGPIYDGVHIAGVNVGGMTKEDAKYAVTQSIKDSYKTTNMVVTVLDHSVEIPAEYVGDLDVDKAVNLAYRYGRRGNSQTKQDQIDSAAVNGHHVDISSCLALQEDHIRSTLSELGNIYSSTLVQSTYQVVGEKPSADDIQSGKNFQKLVVTLGIPEYGLDMDSLYQTVLDGYSRNVFQVTGHCGTVMPDPIDLEAILEKYQVAPVDAKFNPETSQLEKELFGCGFSVADAKKQLDSAKPGSTIEIPFIQLQPEISTQKLVDTMFKDVLSTYTAVSNNNNSNRNTNLRLACESIDGVILSPGAYFSYNATLGKRTTEKGYKSAPAYSGGQTVNSVGGGICQVSSTLYYCTLVADLQIEERTNHSFRTTYVPYGMDATVSWGSLDFCFINSTNHPIMITAQADGPETTVSILGIDDKDYYVEMEYDILKEYPASTKYQTMSKDNPEGYRDGDYIVTPYKGYDVNTYRCKYDKETKALISKEKEALSKYKRRDAIICEISETTPTTPPDGGIDGNGGVTDSGDLPIE